METDRCPGCGAKVRPDASWCSLCYQDLRPPSELVTAAAVQGGSSDGAAAPLVEAFAEPDLAEWPDDDIVDAELVGEDGRVIAPRSGLHDADQQGAHLDPRPESDAGQGPAGDAGGASDEPSRLAGLTWSCRCGEMVSFDEDACPVCGGAFLGDLRETGGGRHRPGSTRLSWLPESRQVRVAGAVFIAIALSVLITVFLSLFG